MSQLKLLANSLLLKVKNLFGFLHLFQPLFMERKLEVPGVFIKDTNVLRTLEDIQILHDSPHYIIVNKAWDVVVNSDDPHRMSVSKQLERLYPDLVQPSLRYGFYFCHRLDFSTSGILCIAKYKKASSAAAKTFEKKTAQKFYLAILRGHVSKNYIEENLGIGEDSRVEFKGIRMATQNDIHCSHKIRKSLSRMILLERGICYGYPASKVLLQPLTGRRHQLRLHMSHLGHTIVGDFTYSNRRDLSPHRMFLHAFNLRFKNPIEQIDVQAPDPFTEFDLRNEWTPVEKIFSIQDAIRILDEKNDLIYL